MRPALGVWSLNHWTAREFHPLILFPFPKPLGKKIEMGGLLSVSSTLILTLHML